jgi:hypothetical protein
VLSFSEDGGDKVVKAGGAGCGVVCKAALRLPFGFSPLLRAVNPRKIMVESVGKREKRQSLSASSITIDVSLIDRGAHACDLLVESAPSSLVQIRDAIPSFNIGSINQMLRVVQRNALYVCLLMQLQHAKEDPSNHIADINDIVPGREKEKCLRFTCGGVDAVLTVRYRAAARLFYVFDAWFGASHFLPFRLSAKIACFFCS